MTVAQTLSTWIDGLIWSSHVDSSCVRQVVRNTPEQFSLTIHCTVDGRQMVVEIKARADVTGLACLPACCAVRSLSAFAQADAGGSHNNGG